MRYIRALRKMWAVVVVCQGTHAVKLYLVRGYSTEDFLLAWAWHTSDWGVPLTVYTDNGTQLVSAGQKICEKEASLDWEKIAAGQGITWRTCPAGNKSKRTFLHIYGKTNLTTLEMETALK